MTQSSDQATTPTWDAALVNLTVSAGAKKDHIAPYIARRLSLLHQLGLLTAFGSVPSLLSRGSIQSPRPKA